MFLRVSCYFQHPKKFGVEKYFFFLEKQFVEKYFFLEKQFFLISRFMLFSTLKKNIYIEKCPFTYWWWFLQIVDIETVAIYIHYILYSLVLILYLKCGGGLGGGGGCNGFLTCYAIYNISWKKIQLFLI